MKSSEKPDPIKCNGCRSKVFYTMVAIKANSKDAMGQLISDNVKRRHENTIQQKSPGRQASHQFTTNVEELRRSPERFRSPGRRSDGKADSRVKPMFQAEPRRSRPIFGQIKSQEEEEKVETTRGTMLVRQTDLVCTEEPLAPKVDNELKMWQFGALLSQNLSSELAEACRVIKLSLGESDNPFSKIIKML